MWWIASWPTVSQFAKQPRDRTDWRLERLCKSTLYKITNRQRSAALSTDRGCGSGDRAGLGRICAQTVPKLIALKPIPGHSSARGRRDPCLRHQAREAHEPVSVRVAGQHAPKLAADEIPGGIGHRGGPPA